MHATGCGVRRDDGLAARYYRDAAAAGVARAMFDLAVLFANRAALGA